MANEHVIGWMKHTDTKKNYLEPGKLALLNINGDEMCVSHTMHANFKWGKILISDEPVWLSVWKYFRAFKASQVKIGSWHHYQWRPVVDESKTGGNTVSMAFELGLIFYTSLFLCLSLFLFKSVSFSQFLCARRFHSFFFRWASIPPRCYDESLNEGGNRSRAKNTSATTTTIEAS